MTPIIWSRTKGYISSKPIVSERNLYLFSVGEGDVMVFEKRGSH
jgi:hypothetical protein